MVVIHCKAIAQNLLCILNGRLIYLGLLTISTNRIYRIVVPLYLHRVILDLIQVSPIAYHMDERKTCDRLKVRFWDAYENGYQ